MANHQREFDEAGPIEVDPEGPVTREKVARAVEKHPDLTLCLVAEDTMALSGPFDLEREDGPRYQCALLVQAPDQWVTFSVRRKRPEPDEELPVWKRLWVKYRKWRLQKAVDKAHDKIHAAQRSDMRAGARLSRAEADFKEAVEERNKYHKEYPDL